MDLKYLTEYARKHNPLELNKIKSATKNKQFYVVATNTDNGKPVYLDPNEHNFYRCLRATSSLPFFTRGLCNIRGLSLMDGAWSDPIPAKSAIKFGANKIVVVRPHPLGYKIDGLSYLGLIAGYWWRDNPKISNKFFEEHDDYNKAVDFLSQNHKNVEITQICPDDVLKSTVLGTTPLELLQDYHSGLEKGMDFLNADFNL